MISLGFDLGKSGADGVWGPKTEAAYEDYLATRPKDPTVFTPVVAKPWWESSAMLSSIGTVAAGVGTVAATVSTGGLAALATPTGIGAITAVITGLGGIYGTATRQAPIDPDLVVKGVRITRNDR